MGATLELRADIGSSQPRELGCCRDTQRLEMALDESYVEAVLEWGPDGPTSGVQKWLEGHDLQVLTMRAGLLISGNRESFESAFDIQLENAKPPVHLPVPEALRGTVGAITIPPPRQYTG